MASRAAAPARRGLTDLDLERITRATEAARSPGTHRIYRYAWEQWATWCAERGFEPLPADPAAMCAFMTQRVADWGPVRPPQDGH